MKKKRFKWIAVLLIICVFLAGCGIRLHAYTDSELKQVAAQLLEEKYGEEFVVYHTWSRSSTTFFADCAPADETEIVFELIAEKNGDALLADGYVLGILEQQIKDVLQPEVQEVFPKSFQRGKFMQYTNVPWVEQLQEYTLEDYMNKADNDFVIYEIYVDNISNIQNDLDIEYEFLSKVVSDKIMGGDIPNICIHLFFVDSEMLGECKEYYSTVYNRKDQFAEDLKAYNDFFIKYKEGIIEMTFDQYKEQREEINTNEK